MAESLHSTAQQQCDSLKYKKLATKLLNMAARYLLALQLTASVSLISVFYQ